MDVQFDNTYVELPQNFFSRVSPETVPAPETVRVNDALARRLGFDPAWLASEQGAEFAVGNRILPGSEPIATVYAGHQFGNWVPRLGDGRAHLLGEIVDDEGKRFDVQLKGSGRTPYSRRGDGRSPLGPVLREYVISEAMAALGIPTTRSLVAARTGATVRRQETEPGGVLVRVARSHVRVGTFEYFVGQRDEESLATLAAYVIERHYPELDPDADDAPLQLLEAYAERLASLVAKWQLVGFIHGVMNTDNMLLSGETVDYGPCAFMNAYDPATVYSSIDRHGRYAFGNQPPIAQWNLSRLAEALLRVGELSDDRVERAQAVVDQFPARFQANFGSGMARKLGFAADGVPIEDEQWSLFEDLLELMTSTGADYTLTFRRLAETLDEVDGERLGALPAGFGPWLEQWHEQVLSEGDAQSVAARMREVSPRVIPRNHRVNAAIASAVEGDDGPFHDLVDAVTRPFEWPDDRSLAEPPDEGQEIAATFCGT